MDTRSNTDRIETSGIIAGIAFALLIILSLLVVGAIFLGV